MCLTKLGCWAEKRTPVARLSTLLFSRLCEEGDTLLSVLVSEWCQQAQFFFKALQVFSPYILFSENMHIYIIYPEPNCSHGTTTATLSVKQSQSPPQFFSSWRFVPYKSLSVTWLESELVMMLSAGTFHTAVLSSRGSAVYVCVCVYVLRVQLQSGKAMNDAKWKRGRQTLNSSFCTYHVSYYKCIYYKRRLSASYNCYCISACFLLPCTPVSSSGPLDDITYLGIKNKKRRQAKISHVCMLTRLFGLLACSATSRHPHVLRCQQFVYPSLTLGQQNGHFLCICVSVCVCSWQQFLAFLWWPGSLSHAMWEEVSPSIIDCADWLEKPLHVCTHPQTLTYATVRLWRFHKELRWN